MMHYQVPNKDMTVQKYVQFGFLATWKHVTLPGLAALANPWVQDLCKHPSILPNPLPPIVKIHNLAP